MIDTSGRELACGRDLASLRVRLAGRARQAYCDRVAETAWERTRITDWDFGALPEFVETPGRGVTVRGYPALVAEGERLALRLLDDPQRAQHEHRVGVAALIRQRLRPRFRYVEKELAGRRDMCLQFAPVGSCETLCRDILEAVTAEVFLQAAALPRDRAQFEACIEAGSGALVAVAGHIAAEVEAALAAFTRLRRALEESIPPPRIAAVQDVHRQLERLIYPGFVTRTPAPWRRRLPTLIAAADLRLEKLPGHIDRDRALMREVNRRERTWEGLGGRDSTDPRVTEFGWLIEEYRVSRFAQELGTVTPVSGQRLARLQPAIAAAGT